MVKRCCLSVCLAIVTMLLLTMTVLAAMSNVSIQGRFVVDSMSVSKADISLYQVAVLNEDGSLVKTDEFPYAVDIDVTDSESLTALAFTLYSYVERDEPASLLTDSTDSRGEFSFENLAPGLYLITGEPVVMGSVRYTPNPVAIRLPYTGEDGQWVSYADLELKFTSSEIPSGGGDDDTVNVKALKVWRGNDCYPESVQVDLLRDGEVYDSQTLSEENNWRYLWTGLSDRYDWLVVETVVPEGYQVNIEKEGITFVVTNRYIDESIPEQPENPEPEDKPDEPSEPPVTPEPEDKPEEPPEETPGDNPEETPDDGPDEPGLPQTGQCWWPVPVFLLLGIVLIGIGLWREKRRL